MESQQHLCGDETMQEETMQPEARPELEAAHGFKARAEERHP